MVCTGVRFVHSFSLLKLRNSNADCFWDTTGKGGFRPFVGPAAYTRATNTQIYTVFIKLLYFIKKSKFLFLNFMSLNVLHMNSIKLVFPLHLISWKKDSKRCCDTKRQSQFTPKMKANAASRLLSSLVWIDHYNQCNGMTTFMEFMTCTFRSSEVPRLKKGLGNAEWTIVSRGIAVHKAEQMTKSKY